MLKSGSAAFRRSKPEEEVTKIMLKFGRSKSVSVPPGVFEKFHGSVTPEMYYSDTQLTK